MILPDFRSEVRWKTMLAVGHVKWIHSLAKPSTIMLNVIQISFTFPYVGNQGDNYLQMTKYISLIMRRNNEIQQLPKLWYYQKQPWLAHIQKYLSIDLSKLYLKQHIFQSNQSIRWHKRPNLVHRHIQSKSKKKSKYRLFFRDEINESYFLHSGHSKQEINLQWP